MEKFVIQGGKPLNGVVEIGGYKNAAGACLAAVLLSEEPVTLHNLPLVEDVFGMIKVLESMGATIEWLDKRTLRVHAGEDVDPAEMDFDLVSKTRVSVVFIGPLLARFKKFKISHPGGDRIGLRPITTHIEALQSLGAKVEQEGDFYFFDGSSMAGRQVVLKEFSVTATEVLLMASVLLPGRTVLKGAAGEAQVQDLGKMLVSMGAKIQGLGTHTIVIDGVKKLRGTAHGIVADPLETGTFLVAGALVPGPIEIKKANTTHLDLFFDKLREIGVKFTVTDPETIVVEYSADLKPARVQALPYPGFPTDLLPIIVPLLTQAAGKSLIHDPLYENRFTYLLELRKMGADIEVVDPHRAFVYGKTSLKGKSIESWDIRAGASLILAGLAAQGQTSIDNAYQIDRGYERIEEKLQKLGAEIQRV
ncbi:MAG: UDP-N-acetylglucosamine 1-carboxyvinyltransferase [Candidatus Wildermuthbacteria bacterium]|nr:UDP-N-acetylglucosamine 1-carboxyvinyltransferase [Candidatus Wildermuthbacteria bacterium]